MTDTSPDFLAQHPLQDNYRLLRIYAWYRVLLASLLLILFASGVDSSVLGKVYPVMYGYSIGIYTALNIITLLRVLRIRNAPKTRHIFLVCLVDILALSTIMHCSGGIGTGLGLLIFITVAAGSIFLQGQIATLLAALACIAILAESLLTGYRSSVDGNPLAAALLGVLLFVTSQIFQYLTRRILTSQHLAAEQASSARTLKQLNEIIVQRMHTGIAVLDRSERIVLYNESAARLLYLPLHADPHDHLSFNQRTALHNALQLWRKNPQQRLQPMQLQEGSPEIQLNFASLANQSHTRTPVQTAIHDDTHDYLLVFVEDTRQISQRAQQLKLASLGHLTANIAHEVRNPLGAISHAAQLLGESDSLSEADRRLADIIQNHSLRVNRIIENVLQLSRRKTPHPERLDLRAWLSQFPRQHKQTCEKPVTIDLQLPEAPLYVTVDISQLEQVVGNLCNNGLRHSEKKTGQPHITLHAYQHDDLDIPCLDIIDYGEGISDKDREQIFEPFFTTEQQGTGLGLYIARELCLANQASLDYKRNNEGLSCFQISFPHADKII